MKLESNKVVVNAVSNEVYNFVKDARNIYELLPQDNIQDFQATETECSFKAQGGITITLIQQELIENEKIIMKSGDKSPFPFNLTINLKDMEGKTEGFIDFDGKVNAFLKMMVQKPLENLFNYMSNKLQEKYNA